MARTNATVRTSSTTDRRALPPDRRTQSAVLHDSAELLKTQNGVLELVARATPLHQTLDFLLRSIESRAPGMLTSILLLEGTRVRHIAAPSLPEEYLRAIDGEPIGPQAGSCGTAAYLGRAVIVEDIATDPLWANYRDTALASGLRACWSTPILDGQHRVLGTFAMYFRKRGRPNARHRELIAMTTHTAAIAIAADRIWKETTQREAQMEEAQRLAQMGSYDWDLRSNRVRRSKELCRIFGLTRDEFPPTFEAYLERVHPDDREATKRTIERAVRDGTQFDFEERIVRPDGDVRYLRSRGMWLTNADGERVKLVGICQDITERKHAEQQARRSEELRIRNEELKAFAYMVSHDLKGPVRGIAGYARELAQRHRSELSERGVRCANSILGAAAELDTMIEDLLQYARWDAERASTSDVDLVEMVNGIVRDRGGASQAAGTEVSLDLAATQVRTWERGLRQVLANVIDNAIKYSKQAAPSRVRIRSEARDDAVRITVADNGIGFDMKNHDRMFGLFNRLVHHDDFEGTGAGLAIVKKIVERMGGRVWAHSAPGVETEFFVELPRQGA